MGDDHEPNAVEPEAPKVSRVPTDDDLRAMAAKTCCRCCKGVNMVAAELLLRRERERQVLALLGEG